MHAEIAEIDLAAIRIDLVERGLTCEFLQDDLLDHICCMVEEKMDSGLEFEPSYGDVMSTIEEDALKNIQHQTLLLLDKKFQKMKKTTYIIGLIGSVLTLTGVFFKTQHWPGASVMICLGFLLATFIFLPFYFILNYREQAEKPRIIFPIVGYLSLAILFTGAVFKIMHWPGAGVALRVSIVVLLVGFLPLYIVQVYKKASESKINIPYIVMLLIGISIVVLLGRVNISKYAIDRYSELTIENTEGLIVVEEKVADLLLEADSLEIEEVEKVHEMALDLLSQIEVMQNNLLQTVDQAGIPIDQVNRRDYRRASQKAIISNGAGNAFNVSMATYRKYLLNVLESPISDAQVSYNLAFGSDHWVTQWEPRKEVREPLILHYHLLSEFALKIALSEYVAIQELMER